MYRPVIKPKQPPLLEFYSGTGFLQPVLDFLGFVLTGTFLNRLGRLIDEGFGFLEAQAGNLANHLDGSHAFSNSHTVDMEQEKSTRPMPFEE